MKSSLPSGLCKKKIETDIAFADRFKKHQMTLVGQAIKQGRDPSQVLPHPDDICIIEGKGYKIIGPSDEAELAIVEGNCKRRDVLPIQTVLEERLVTMEAQSSGNSSEPDFPGAAPLLLVQFVNETLPARFRKSDFELMREMDRYRRLNKRELLKKTRQAWASIGHPKPRGWTFPPFHQVRASLEYLVPAFVGICREIVSVR
jgi:hypothetical protein